MCVPRQSRERSSSGYAVPVGGFVKATGKRQIVMILTIAVALLSG